MPIELPDYLVIAVRRFEILNRRPEGLWRSRIIDPIVVPVGGRSARDVAIAKEVVTPASERVGSNRRVCGCVRKALANRLREGSPGRVPQRPARLPVTEVTAKRPVRSHEVTRARGITGRCQIARAAPLRIETSAYRFQRAR